MQPRITLGFLRHNDVRSGLASGDKIRIINAQVRETHNNQNALLSLYVSARHRDAQNRNVIRREGRRGSPCNRRTLAITALLPGINLRNIAPEEEWKNAHSDYYGK
jgi:hypothetical protein